MADLCETLSTQTSLPGTLFSGQRIWSNAAMRAGHDPCVPAPATEPYFNAMPVLPDDVDLVLGPTTVRTRGVRVPLGQSRVVELDLYSDGDTGGPWSIFPGLEAVGDDGAGTPYYSSQQAIALMLDRKSGQNGEKLYLTMTRKATSGPLVGAVTSFRGANSHSWFFAITE